MNIEKVANYVVITSALVLIGIAVYDRLPSRGSAIAESGKELIGNRLPLPGLRGADTPATVVLFISKTCSFCTESMPFYRRLSALQQRTSQKVRFLVVVPSGRESSEEGQQYLAQHDVRADSVLEMKLSSSGIAATPTIALLDESMRIADIWTGMLTPEQEKEVIRGIETLGQQRQ